MSVPM